VSGVASKDLSPLPDFFILQRNPAEYGARQGKRTLGNHSKRASTASRQTLAQRPIMLSHAEDLADTGPGALERIRAARLTAISLALAADEAERKAQEANEAADKVAEEAARKSGVSSHPGAAKRHEEGRREPAGEGPGAPDPRE
jgi:hypothetical protein